MKEEKPTQDDIRDALAKAFHHKRCRTLKYLYDRLRNAKAEEMKEQEPTREEMQAALASVKAEIDKWKQPTEDQLQDSLECCQDGQDAKIIAAAYYYEKVAREKAATIYQDTIADEMEVRIKSETALHALRKRLKEIEDYLLYRCKQTCAGREAYQGKLKHEANCPAYDLGLVD